MRDITSMQAQWKAQKCTGKNLFNAQEVFKNLQRKNGEFVDKAANFHIKSVYYFTEDQLGKTFTYSVTAKTEDQTNTATGIYLRAFINGVEYENGNIFINTGFYRVSITITPQTTSDYVKISYGTGGHQIVTVKEPMLEENSILTDYEPYCGGSTSNFHIENCKGGYFSVTDDFGLKVIGKMGQNILTGKNLLNAQEVFKNLQYENGEFVGNQGEVHATKIYFTEDQLGKTFTYSLTAKTEDKTNTATGIYLRAFINNQSIYNDPSGAGGININTGFRRISITFTPQTIQDYVHLTYGTGTQTITFKEPMLEESSVLTAYEPYCGGIPGPNPEYPQGVQCVKAGTKIKVTDRYPIGGQITTTRDGQELIFDIVDKNKSILTNGEKGNTLELLMHDIFTYGTIPFSAPQLMYATDVELLAGNYKFTLDHARYNSGTEYDGTYMFTTTKSVPIGGGFRHTNSIGDQKSSYAKNDVLGNYITTYNPIATDRGSAIENDLAVTEWDGVTVCIDLGTFTASKRTYHTDDGKHNFTERQSCGSSRWRDSAIRQYLNSDAPAVSSDDTTTISNWWTPQNVFDRIPNGATLAGFLHGLDPAFVATLGEVEVKTGLSNCDRTNDKLYDITYDKVFLLSKREVFGTDTSNSVLEGEFLEYFKNAADTDRIKYQNGSARYWYLRTPLINFAHFVVDVKPSGSATNIYAIAPFGVVPACCLKTSEKIYSDQEIVTPCDLYEGDIWYPMTGKVVKNHSFETLTPNITAYKEGDYFVLKGQNSLSKVLTDVVCNYYRTGIDNFCIRQLTDVDSGYAIYDSRFETIEQLMQFFEDKYTEGNPVIVIAKLNTPIVEQYEPQPVFAPTGEVNINQSPIDLLAKLETTCLVRR